MCFSVLYVCMCATCMSLCVMYMCDMYERCMCVYVCGRCMCLYVICVCHVYAHMYATIRIEDSLWCQFSPSSLFEMESLVHHCVCRAHWPTKVASALHLAIGAGGLQIHSTRSGSNGFWGFELRSCAYAAFTHWAASLVQEIFYSHLKMTALLLLFAIILFSPWHIIAPLFLLLILLLLHDSSCRAVYIFAVQWSRAACLPLLGRCLEMRHSGPTPRLGRKNLHFTNISGDSCATRVWGACARPGPHCRWRLTNSRTPGYCAAHRLSSELFSHPLGLNVKVLVDGRMSKKQLGHGLSSLSSARPLKSASDLRCE